MMLRMPKMKWSRAQTKRRKSRSGMHLSSSSTCRGTGQLSQRAVTSSDPP